MENTHRLDQRLPGLRRWTEWLEDRFPLAGVAIVDPGVFCSGARWELRFSSSSSATVEVSETLLYAGEEEFDRVTTGLEQTGWTTAARLSRRRFLRVYGRPE